MTEALHGAQPVPESTEAPGVAAEVVHEHLVAGRPIEDRSFEVVEIGIGASAGLALGAVVAGPIGAAAGAIIGGAAAIMAGEAIERRVGHAAETTDATAGEGPHS